MISSGSIVNAMGLERTAAQTAGMKTLNEFDGSPEAMRRFMEFIVHDHSKITEQLIEQRVAMATMPGHAEAQRPQRAYRGALTSDPGARQRFDIRHRLPMTKVPMTMVWGAKDNFAPPEFAVHLAAMLPNVEFVMFENSGYQAQNDGTERFNRLATDFFAAAAESIGAAAQ